MFRLFIRALFDRFPTTWIKMERGGKTIHKGARRSDAQEQGRQLKAQLRNRENCIICQIRPKQRVAISMG